MLQEKNSKSLEKLLEEYWINKLSAHADQQPVLLPSRLDTPVTEIVQRVDLLAVREIVQRVDLLAVREIAKRKPLAIFTLLLSGYALTLHRFTSEKKLLIATSGIKIENEDLTDLFVSVNLQPEDTFRNYITSVKSELQKVFKYRDYDKNSLLASLQEKDLRWQDLVQATFSYGVVQERPENDFFSLHVSESEDETSVILRYRKDLYHPDYAQSFVSEYTKLIEQFDRYLAKSVDDIFTTSSFLPFLHFANGEVTSKLTTMPKHNIISLFREQVSNHPEAVAVVAGAESLTFAELDQKSNQLAHYLIDEYRICKEQPVGLMSENKTWLITGLLAILKAGGCFVPIAENLPARRKAHIFEDTQLKVLLLQSDYMFDLPDYEGQVFALDIQLDTLDTSIEPPSVTLTPTQLAYIMYTSGTTGKPKGVQIEHKSVVNYANWVVKSQQITIQDRSALLSSYAFDLGYTSIWGCLMGGATLHLLNMEMNKSTGKLLEYLVEHAVTFIKTTPTLFYMLVHHTRFVSLAEKLKLRLILLGGEPIRVAGIRRYLDYAPRATFVNHYGPTEATIGAVYHRIPTDDLEEYEAHPIIGKPLKNTEAVVVNEQGHLQPFGVKGELCLAGLGLARGYWQDRGATKDKFRPHPFREGVKMYRTGDQAILMSDGSILLSGRLDDQVKIRGYRVERKEIENVLRQLPGIQDAYVDVMQHNQDQAKILVAYLITAKEESEKQLKKALAQWLPEYMIPSQFIALSQFPTTANGKLDRQALKQRYATHQRRVENFEEAETATEKKLTTLWSEVLSLPSVSINEDFFALGGDSLRATQLLTEIHQSLGADVTLEDIFTYPSIKHLARIIDDAGKNDQKDIKQLPAAASYPVSSFQKRLWVLHSLEEDAAAYNQMKVFQLQGTINAKALTTAFRKLIMRHESLRTSFAMVNEDVRQILHQEELAKSFTVNYVDVSSANDPESAAEEIVREESHKVFDLQKAPLLRATLIALNAKTHIIQYTIHHSVSDGRSNEIILHDLQAYYKAIINGFDDSLKPLPYQFKDFLVWHQGHLSERYEEHKQYWLSHFSEEITPLELPLDKPRPSVQTFKGGVVEKSFSKQFTARLAGFAQGESATFFMLLVSLINVLLHKYSANRVITIGTPVSTRQKEPLQQVVGPFLNTLPLRNRVDPNETFRNTLRHVKTTLVQSYEHQNFPLEDILDLLPLERDLSRGALFDVLVDYNNYHKEQKSPGSSSGRRATFETVSRKTTASQADLGFNFKNENEALHIGLVYNPDLFLERTACLMLGHLEQLAETCINNPDQQIALLDYITAEERHMICKHFNDTQVKRKEANLFALFEQQVALHPDATAITTSQTRLTYGDTQDHTNRIASFLLSRSVGKGDIVGVMLDRTENLPLAILGILKTGACYLPLERELPSERLRYLTEDSQIKYLIAERDTQSLPGVEVFPIATLKAYTDKVVAYPTLHPQDAAYVIYTSGSTGKPKGVRIAHASLLNFLLSMQKVPGITRHDVMLAITTSSFDISLLELLLPLVSGASVAIASQQTYTEAALLEKRIQEAGVTILQATPTFLNLITQSGWQGSAQLKILCGGEPLPAALGRKLMECSAELWNMYGPTETTVWSTCKLIKTEEDLKTVGKPIDNTRVYILDEYQRMVAMGNVGEICIGGAGVALGYHNREELNRERFIKSPYEEDTVIYRTGDLGQWTEKGEVVVWGRNDDQVKIRGHRVETGEVESALLEFEGITQGVVVARQPESGDKQLVGYYVSETAVATAELRSYLSKRLPGYMIPVHYVHLDQLPLTPNGKVDRRALPDPEHPIEDSYEAPSGEIEEKLVEIWSEVLNLDKQTISVNKSFFELGGHSLNAMQAINQVQKQLDHKILLKEFFRISTIKALAKNLEVATFSQMLTGKEAEQSSEETPIMHKQEHYPLSHAQRRLWILDQFEEVGRVYNLHGKYQVQIEDTPAFKAAWETLVKRHDILRTIFVTVDGQVYQEVVPWAPADMEICLVDLSETQNPEKEYLTVKSQLCNKPFDLSQAPLFRASLIKRGEKDYVFLLVLHHIISDGWSMQIIERDLMKLYRAHSQGVEANLPVLTQQYKDHALLQKKLISTGLLVPHRKYWHQTLSGEIPVLELSSDYLRPSTKTYSGANVAFKIDRELADGFEQLCREESATLFMGVVALSNVLLSHYSGQDDIIVGLPIAGRDQYELEDQVGFYVNMLALRSKINLDASFRSLLLTVKETTLQAYDHQAYPFDLLVEELNLRRDMSRSPLFDVMVLGEGMQLEAASWQHEDDIVMQENEVSKYDLTIGFGRLDEGMMMHLNYNTSLFSHKRARRMASHFRHLISSIISQDETPLYKLSYLSDEERHRLLHVYNTAPNFDSSKSTLQTLFAQQVRQSPYAIAVACGKKELSYTELDKLSNRMAHYLRETLQVQLGDRVGVSLGKDEWLIVVLWGIVKSGAVYVPVDQNFPAQRKSYIIEDASLKTLISEDGCNEEEAFSAVNVRLSSVREQLVNHSEEPVDNLSSAKDTLYIIYTSGTTGEPKGVQVSHESLVNLCEWSKEIFYDAHEKPLRVGLTASINFDVSILQMFSPFVSGATLVLIADEVKHNPSAYVEALIGGRVALLDATPSYFQTLLPWFADSASHSLRYALIAGEAMDEDFVAKFEKVFGKSCKLINAYGPTETTVYSTYTYPEAGKRVSIGQPVRNSNLYIVDKKGQLVAEGIRGELCISGVGVSQGYLGMEALTKERFITNPFGPGRLYKTGDIGRWLPGGDILFEGRNDSQVKVRGYRIELGEITSVLHNCPTVSQAVVKVWGEGADKYLVGYYTGQSQADSEVYQHMQRTLPLYMVPTQLVYMERFPLNANGKIDQKQLEEPQSREAATTYIAPKTALQEQVAAIWKDILETQPVGIKDNFFELGGHSLKAMRVINSLYKQHGYKISMKDIFNNQTVETLSEGISSYQQNQDDPRNLVLSLNKHQGISSKLYVLPPALGTSTMFRGWANDLEGTADVYGFQYKGFEEDVREKSIDDIAERSFQEIKRHTSNQGEISLVGYSMGALVAFELIKRLEVYGYRIAKFILIDRGPDLADIQSLDDDQTSDTFITELRKWGYEEERIERLLDVYQHNINLMKQFEAFGKIDTKIVVVEAKNSLSNMKQWRAFTNSNIVHYWTRGGHYDILNEENLPLLISLIKQQI